MKKISAVLGFLAIAAFASLALPVHAAEGNVELSALQIVLNELEIVIRQLEAVVAKLSVREAMETNVILENITQNLSGINVTLARMSSPSVPLTVPQTAVVSRSFLASPAVQFVLVSLLLMVGISLFWRKRPAEAPMEAAPTTVAVVE